MNFAIRGIVLCSIVITAKAQTIEACSSQHLVEGAEPYCRTLEAHRNSSLAHFRIAEAYLHANNFQTAANEFREVLNGDLDPKWTEVWAHINLGTIFARTGQNDRAANEYKQARRIGDDEFGAQDEAARLLRALGVEVPPSALVIDPRNRVEPLVKIPPDYTDEARIAELEGTVLLKGTIGEDGLAHELTVLRPLGLGLDEKALDAVRLWLFDPRPINAQSTRTSAIIAVDFSLPSKLSRWHLSGVVFNPPPGASRPEFVNATYPPGTGVPFNPEIMERASILAAVGRPATMTLRFDVDEQGRLTHVRSEGASDDRWENQAIALMREWRFKPGMKDGKTIPVSGSMNLMWVPDGAPANTIDRFQNAASASSSAH